MSKNLLNETFKKHLKLLHKHLKLNEATEQDVTQVQSFIDNNQFLKGKTVALNDLIDGDKFILYVSDDSLNHIKERHKDESKPGSTFDTSVNLRDVLTNILSKSPSEQSNGRVKWLGVDTGKSIGKMGVKQGTPEEVANMKDYQMPDGKKEMVKISIGERNPTNEVSVITSELGKLGDGKTVLSLITMFPGGTKIDGKEIPMDRGQFASQGLYFVVSKLNEGLFEPDDDTIDAKLAFWLEHNSSGYTSSFEVDTVLDDLDIKKGTPEFNELVDAFKERGYELKGNEFVKIVKKVEKGSGVSDKEVKDTANQYIKHFGKGSSSLQMSARDFVSMSQGGGDPDVRSNFPNWSDENFKQLLDILYTAGGLKRPVDETFQKHLNLLHKKLNESMSIEDLATVSDEALDNAYHYGRSTPGNTFGWQANLKSAEFAKRVIDSGVTDIEKISDAIHSGWNETAKKFVANPDQFSDTQKLRDNGKFDAKIEQRRKLSNVNYSSLPEEEKEKDRVVARALLNAIQTP